MRQGSESRHLKYRWPYFGRLLGINGFYLKNKIPMQLNRIRAWEEKIQPGMQYVNLGPEPGKA